MIQNSRFPATPILNLKQMHLRTPLEKVRIITARDYLAEAEWLAEALRARQGSDVNVTCRLETDDESRTTIALGDLSTNPLIARLYHAYLCWTDRRYPGPGGYEVRTIHNPFGDGRNLALLGCSDQAGARRAAERFLTHIGQSSLLPLLDVEMTGPADAQFRASAGNYYPYKAGLSDGLRYYLTGRIDLGESYRRYLLSFDADNIQTAAAGLHMMWLFDMALWDLIEEQPLFSDADRLRITNFFLALARSEEGIGYIDVPEVMNNTGLRQNHHTNTAFAVWLAARYFERDYPDLPGLMEEIAYWRRVVAHTFAPGLRSSRGQCETWHEWELELDINFNYFTAAGQSDFVESGALRAAAERIILSCANTGVIANSGDLFPWQQPPPCSLLGKAAFAYGDPRYRFLTHRKSLVWHRVGMTALNGVGREYDDGLASARPDDHIGARHCIVDPAFHHFHAHAPRFFRERMFLQLPNTPAEKSLDKIAFRSGWAPDDQYLLVDGIAGASHGHEDANAVIQFDEFQRTWLLDGDFRQSGVSRHNALTIATDGLGTPLPAFAEMDGIGNLDQIGFSHSIMRNYGGADWGRAIVWLRGRAFVFLDRVTALPSAGAGKPYHLCLRWFTLGDLPSLTPASQKRLTVAQRAPAGARVDDKGVHIDTLLGEARATFHAAPGDYRLIVDLDLTRATTWANSVILQFDETYPVEVIVGDRTDPPGKLENAVIEGRARLGEGVSHSLRIYLGTAMRATIRSVKLIPADETAPIILTPTVFTPASRRTASETATFHIVSVAACEHRLISGNATLADQWQRYPWHPVTSDCIREWQQTARVQMSTGAAFTFVNLLYAETPDAPRQFEMRPLRDGLARVSGGDDAIIGFGPLEAPGLSTDATLVYIGARRLAGLNSARFESPQVRLRSDSPVAFELDARGRAVFDCEQAATVELNIGAHTHTFMLTAGRHILDTPAFCSPLADLDALETALTEHPRKIAPMLRANTGVQLAPSARIHGPLRALGGDGQGWLIGDAAGAVRKLSDQFDEVWRYECGGAINTLSCGWANGERLIVAGGEDCRLYALSAEGRLLWQRAFGVLPETYGLYAGLGQIRRAHIDDLDADGAPEIYVSPDNMHLHALTPDGRERWRKKILYGPFVEYQSVDLYGEGQRVLVGGMSSNTCHSAVQVIDHYGRYIDLYVNDGWTSSLGAIWVGDVDNDGKFEIVAGTNRGWMRVFNARSAPLGRPMPPFDGDVTLKSFEWAEPRDRIRWARHLGEPVRAVAAFAGLVVGGADNGFVTAFDPFGARQWSVQAAAGVTHVLPLDERCAVIDQEGGVMMLDAGGCVIDRARLSAGAVAAHKTARSWVIASFDGGLYVL